MMFEFDYKKTLEYLFQQLPIFQRDGKAAYKADLQNTIALDDYLGHPHKNYKTIHIAGTNGKGSVSHMIASVLQEAGLKTGLYTSPHLDNFRERIKVNGVMIPENKVTWFINEHKNFIDAINPTFFELTTAMAFDHFAKEEVDVAIIEVGLGGKLDCTNIISPILSVITNIGFDHMDILGNSLVEIAREKSGIIKSNIPVVIGQTQPELKHIFEVKTEMIDAPLYFADKNLEIKTNITAEDFSCQTFEIYEYDKPYIQDLKLDLTGVYQQKNILTAIKALQLLKERLHFDYTYIFRGLSKVKENTGLRGRWQIIGQKPLTVIDTAHNQDGIQFVMEQVRKLDFKKKHIIFGMARDKSVDTIIKLLPTDAQYYFTKAQIPRALDEKELMDMATSAGLKGSAFDNVNTAMAEARKNATEKDMILVTGSTYIAGELDEMKN